MSATHSRAFVVVIATPRGDRYFRHVKKGRVSTAWCVAGATLFMSEQAASIWRQAIADKNRKNATVHRLTVDTFA